MAKDSYPHQDIEPAARDKWEAIDLHTADLSDASKEPYYLLFEFPFPSGDLHIGHWYAYALTDVFARLKRMQGNNVLFPMGFDSFGLPAENAAMKKGVNVAEWMDESIDRMRAQVRSMGTSLDWSKEVVTSSPEYYKWTQWLFLKLYDKGLAERREAPVKWCPQDQTVLANEQVIDGHCERCGSEVEEKRLTQWFLRITQYAERLLEDLDPLPWREDIKDAQRAWIGKSEGARITFRLSSEHMVDVFTTRPDTIFGATYLVLAPEHPVVEELRHTDFATNWPDISAYCETTKRKTERERSENKGKTGVRIDGVTARNPATTEDIPIYVADYVLASYGTGAVMAVPAHDERDFEFATKHGLPVRQVVAPSLKQSKEPGMYRPGTETVTTDGVIVFVKHWSEEKYLALKWKTVDWGALLTGTVDEGMTPIETALKELREETGYVHAQVRESLGVVDGLFYHVPKEVNKLVHGHIFCVELTDGKREPVAEKEEAMHDAVWLTLDELQNFLTPDTHQYALKLLRDGYAPYTGSGSLVNSDTFTGRDSEEAKWEIADIVGGTRETNYRIRDWLVSRQRYWGCPIPIVYDPEGKPHPVPVEHLPWRLPTDVNSTMGKNGVSPLGASKELQKRVERIFGPGWTAEYDTLDVFVDSSWYYARYLDPANEEDFSSPSLMKKWLPVDRYSGGSEHTTVHLLYSRFFYKALYDLGLVPTEEPFNERFNRGLIMATDGRKMSKRWGNVINPDEQVRDYGADAVRFYLAFIGPYNEPGHYPWKPEGLASMRRFLDRVYALRKKVQEGEATETQMRALARAAHKVSVDLERFKTNTAVSALMVLMNAFEDEPVIARESFKSLLLILAPFAPHLAEHLYETVLNGKGSVHQLPWPQFDPALLVEDTVTIGVQIAGKTREEITISPDASEEEAVQAALALPKIAQALPRGAPSRVIYRQGKILNLIP